MQLWQPLEGMREMRDPAVLKFSLKLLDPVWQIQRDHNLHPVKPQKLFEQGLVGVMDVIALKVQAEEMLDREKEIRKVVIKGMAVHKTSKSHVAVWLFTALLGLIAHPETPRFLARQRLSGFHCIP